MKYCNQKSDIPPNMKHYAAVIFSTVHIPGDERSRTNPGHGYPAEDKPIVEYIAFSAPQEMQQWVEQNRDCNNFVIIEALSKTVSTKTEVLVS